MSTFTKFKMQEFCLQTIEELGFQKPTPIQEQVIPLVYKNSDIIGISQTGTGKTHAFLLPVMDRIDPKNNSVQAVITAPTRELATQIYNNAKLFTKYNSEIKVSLIVGGNDRQKTVNKLAVQPHVVIGTPGRIKDLSLDEQALKITTASTFIVDEADMTLEFGYLEDIDAVAGKMRDDLRMMVFSATIPQMLRPFLKKYMKSPVLVEIDDDKVTTENVEHILIATKHKNRYEVLKKIIESIDPYVCIIFANTRSDVASTTKKLREDGFKVGEIHGDLEPRERKQMMRRIQNNEYQFIVATDIAARGIDIDGVSLVINDDLPTDLEYFVHRVGRTGRNGMKGTAITLYEPAEDDLIAKLEERGVKFVPKELKNGQLVTTHDRNRRKHYKRRQNELDPSMKGYVKKTKKKVKPGYKKRIKKAIKEDEQQKRKLELRHKIRKAKRARQKQHRRERNAR